MWAGRFAQMGHVSLVFGLKKNKIICSVFYKSSSTLTFGWPFLNNIWYGSCLESCLCLPLEWIHCATITISHSSVFILDFYEDSKNTLPFQLTTCHSSKVRHLQNYTFGTFEETSSLFYLAL